MATDVIEVEKVEFHAPENSSGNGNGPRTMDIATTKAAQEVQAAMIVAKRFPRDMDGAMRRIEAACKRPTLAAVAAYSYPRGGQEITGPSIRLAEEIARQWGNMDFGFVELDNRAGESSVMAYAWDLETNTRTTRVFAVKHERHTKRGVTQLTDPRDIYELVANQAARRIRACILTTIPGDVTESAISQCDATLKSASSKVPIAERVKAMLARFAEIGVTRETIEAKIGHSADAISEREIIQFGKHWTAIKDGYVKSEELFPAVQATSAAASTDKPATATEKAKNRVKKAEVSTELDPTAEPCPGCGVDLHKMDVANFRESEAGPCCSKDCMEKVDAKFREAAQE